MLVYPLLVVAALLAGTSNADDAALHQQAVELAHRFIVADTHIDAPYRMWKKHEDISQPTEGDFDVPRARKGGLDVPFMSIYTPAELEQTGGSKSLADSLIDLVQGFAIRWPSTFGIAGSVDEVLSLRKQRKIALVMGMENGSPIDDKLGNVKYFHDRGIRYLGLAHSKDNHLSDSSYDTRETWGGLSPFGKKVIAEMNRVGIMVDVSHISDKAFYQVMELSKAPVIASHSSCRAFTPGFQRNMDDDMIRLLAKKGGVIQINFGSVFVNGDCYHRYDTAKDLSEKYAREHNLGPDDPKVEAYREEFLKEHPVGFADISDVVANIDHVVKLVGVEHVGLGSDFDGVGDSLPTGLKDVSQYPNLIYELLKLGYTPDDIEKICSGNLFRVWEQVDRVAAEMSAK
jgi:membrane dipeptidase